MDDLNGQRILAQMNVFWYKLSKGRLFGSFRGAPVLLLTTTGRKSGKRRTTPLLYISEGNRLAIVASNGGRDRDPYWRQNLKTNSNAEAQVKGERYTVRAEKANTAEKGRLWPLLTKMYPSYDDYQRKTKREIPVVFLTPSTGSMPKASQ